MVEHLCEMKRPVIWHWYSSNIIIIIIITFIKQR